MPVAVAPKSNVWERTPLLYSDSLSARLGCNIFLKMESLQPSQCFKQRTQGNLAQEIYAIHGTQTHFVIPSSGNAALSLAYVSSKLKGAKCTVFITLDAATPSVLETLKRYGADIVVFGDKYPEALKKAQEFVAAHPNAVLMHAYDHPTLWQGSSTIIDEVAEQLPPTKNPPDAIICSVGGGSLIGGLLIGCDRNGWDKTRVIAVETTGSDTMYHSVLLTESQDHALPPNAEVVIDEKHGVMLAKRAPTSRATSLGANISAAGVVKKASTRRQRDKSLFTCVSIPDEIAMMGCLGFADDHKTIVDLACGAALGPAYAPRLFEKIFNKELISLKTSDTERPTIVFVVCGGSKVGLKDMNSYMTHLKTVEGQDLEIRVDEGVSSIVSHSMYD